MPSRIVQTISDIADAIRAKTGTTKKIKGEDIPQAIRDIISSPPYKAGMYYDEVDSNNSITKATIFGRILKDYFLPTTITELTIKNVKELPDNFLDASSTTLACATLNLDDEVEKIGNYTFYNSKITEINFEDGTKNRIPKKVTVLPIYSFGGGFKIIDLELHDNITEIQNSAFQGFAGTFKNAELPEKLEIIGDQAFVGQKFAFKKIPASVTSIGSYAFSGNELLIDVTFEGTPTSIGYGAFNACDALVEINVPWSEGTVSGAPWGATNATINYNYNGG